MILYLNASALIKLYVAEEGSAAVRQAVNSAMESSSCLITYAEVCAALARAQRMLRLPESDHRYQLECFAKDWNKIQAIGVDMALVRRAGELSGQFSLRGYDSVHLAAAERAFEAAGRPEAFRFVAFDGRLRAGAAALGMHVLD